MTSQRGDSGMARTPMARKTDGTAPIPSMNRQPKVSGSLENA
uniref:Putative polyol transporter 1 n=1 Tax=Rhizophora mucronata TaxID=61149 RepID=A0A2P2JGW3_RHIMU